MRANEHSQVSNTWAVAVDLPERPSRPGRTARTAHSPSVGAAGSRFKGQGLQDQPKSDIDRPAENASSCCTAIHSAESLFRKRLLCSSPSRTYALWMRQSMAAGPSEPTDGPFADLPSGADRVKTRWDAQRTSATVRSLSLGPSQSLHPSDYCVNATASSTLQMDDSARFLEACYPVSRERSVRLCRSEGAIERAMAQFRFVQAIHLDITSIALQEVLRVGPPGLEPGTYGLKVRSSNH